MPVIVNPFQGATDPTAQAIANVGSAMFGNTGGVELRRQQILDAQRKNVEMQNLMLAVKAGGAQNLGADPTVQSEMIGADYDPAKFGKLGLMGSAMVNGAAGQKTQDWQVGTGQSYENTAGALDAKLANATSIANNTPQPAIGPDGNFAFTTRGHLDGYTPIVNDSDVKGTKLNQNWDRLPTLNENQLATIGAAKAPGSAQTPHNYVSPDGRTSITYDGITDAATGQKLPPGGFIANAQGAAKDVGLGETNTVKTNLETSIVANTNFITQAGAISDLVKKHPESVGPLGVLRGVGQEALQTGSALFNAVGGDGAFQQVKDAAAGAGLQKVLPDMYDPNIPKVRGAYYVLLYNYASALAGQNGRSVSDKDIELARQGLGDPDELFGSANNFLTKVQTAQALAQHNVDHARSLLKNGILSNDPNDANLSGQLESVSSDLKGVSNTATTAVPPDAATGQTAAPPAPGEAPAQPKTAADFAALPKGALYIDPGDGKQYRKP